MPPSVAIIGASADPAKYGHKAVRAYLRRGWTVYPVSPRGGAIEGVEVFRSITEIPDRVDRVSVYVPPAVGLGLLDDIKSTGCTELFLNPGSESEELVAQAERLGLDPIQACSIIEIGETP